METKFHQINQADRATQQRKRYQLSSGSYNINTKRIRMLQTAKQNWLWTLTLPYKPWKQFAIECLKKCDSISNGNLVEKEKIISQVVSVSDR